MVLWGCEFQRTLVLEAASAPLTRGGIPLVQAFLASPLSSVRPEPSREVAQLSS